MTLPARRESAPRIARKAKPRLRSAEQGTSQKGIPSPAHELLARLERAHTPQRRAPAKPGRAKRFGETLLVWSCAAALLSVGYLAFETVRSPSAVAAMPAALDFSDVASRHVQSSEGPALELSGLVRNRGEALAEPEVLLQLAGSRVAIEEPLRLGGAALPPGAERPFTVRVLLPEGTRTVRLLPTENRSRRAPDMPLVSPAWTADAVGG